MAIRYAVVSGNWSDTATWDGGTLPSSTDNVYANNFTVSIDQSVTVNSLKKIANASPVITAGGSFAVTSPATVTITAGIAAADNVSNTSFLVAVGSGAGNANITITTPSIIAGVGTGRVGVQVGNGYTGTLTINANLRGGPASNAYALNNIAPGATIILNGNTEASPSGSPTASGINNSVAATIIVNGNVIGGLNGANGLSNAGIGAILTVNGNVTTISTGTGLESTGNSTQLTINGGITSTAQTTGYYGVRFGGTSAQLTVTGTITGGLGDSRFGLELLAGAAATIRGSIRPGNYSTSGASCPAIRSGGVLRFSGHIYSGGMAPSTGPNGAFPITGTWGAINGEEIYLHVYNDGNYPSGNNGSQTVLTLNGSNLPITIDVRAGVSYGPSAGLTGSLSMPPPESVAAGVPVDNTVGVATVRLADVLTGTGALIEGALSDGN